MKVRHTTMSSTDLFGNPVNCRVQVEFEICQDWLNDFINTDSNATGLQ